MSEEVYNGAIGIDLGTTYSCAAVWTDDADVEIIANDQGNRVTPSYVAFTESERLIGDAAKNQAALNPRNTIFDAKRLIGRRFDDPDVVKDRKQWPFTVVDNGEGAPLVEVDYLGERKKFTPQEISSMVLLKMKQISEAKLGKKVEKAVVTVPAYFSDSQRNATKDAGAIAGLHVLRIINEPTAAAIAYGLDSKSSKEKNVLIFDLGGGTFDVSLLTITDGVFAVKAVAGDTHLGGEDFDNTLLEHFKAEFKKKTGLDISGDPRAQRRLRSACERAKRTLSSVTQTKVEVDSLYQGHDFASSITRARFESINDKAFQSTIAPVESVLKDAKIDKNNVDDIVLVGGSTRIPKIQKLVSDVFGGRALNKSINPDECVAYGAAVQAAVLTNHAGSEKTEGLLLLDVTPLSMGVAMEGNIFGVVVPRNTPVPCIKKRTFTTVEDNQTVVTFPIYQGERVNCTENEQLGEFELHNIPPMPKQQAQLDVTFELDANGILKVTAKERISSKSANLVISNSLRLSSTQINEMIANAEKFKAADKEFQERLEAKQQLEADIANVEGNLSEPSIGMKLGKRDRENVERALAEAMEALELEGDEVEAKKLSKASLGLKRAAMKAFASIR
jgi:L1 cell adhesion molecule like protein